jgi:hypothetical protein
VSNKSDSIVLAKQSNAVCHLVKAFKSKFLFLYHIHIDHKALTTKPMLPINTNTDNEEAEAASSCMFVELLRCRTQNINASAMATEIKDHNRKRMDSADTDFLNKLLGNQISINIMLTNAIISQNTSTNKGNMALITFVFSNVCGP